MKIKQAVRWFLSILVYYSGVLVCLRFLKNISAKHDRWIILRYHRVHESASRDPFHLSVSPAVFESQMNYLKQRYIVTGMPSDQTQEASNKKNRLTITFDDGYLDNYTQAYPILKKNNLPAAIFLTSGLIDTAKKFWWDALEYALGNAATKEVRINYRDKNGNRIEKLFSIADENEKIRTLQALEILGNQLDDSQKEALVEQIHLQCRSAQDTERMVMNWREIREMAENGIEIGAHGVNHKLLTKISREEAVFEIEESKRQIETALGKKVLYFAYPGGQVAGWMQKTAQAIGYAGAFLTTPGENGRKVSPFQLKRRAVHQNISVTPWGTFSKALFACTVEGVWEHRKALDAAKAKIRILYVIDKLTFAGSQKHLYELTRALDPEQFEVKAVSLESGGPLEASFQSAGIAYEVLGISNWNSLAGIRGLFQLISIMRSFKPDIVHAYLFTANVFAPIAARIAGVPVVITSRRDLGDWKSKRQVRISRFTNNFVDFITANSEAVRAAAMSLEEVAIEKTQVIYNGIRANHFQTHKDKALLKTQWGFPAESIVFGTLSNIRKEKDPMTLLNAFLQISQTHPNTYLIYGGRVKDEVLWDKIKTFIATHELQNKVKFAGAVENVPEFLGGLDVFIFTSMSEGFSNSILEAMAAGLPVVASEVGGNQEQVIPGVTGYLFEAGNVSECVHAVEKLLNQGQMPLFGKAARQRILERFTQDRMAHEMSALYTKLLAEKKRVPAEGDSRGMKQEKGVENETACKVS